jgi:homoserine dehydrogenase
MAETVNVGILGKGTVGGAFRELLEERAEMVEEVSGRRPKVTGVLSSDQGDFDEILAASDIVVELIGGTDPARDYVTRALREGRHVVTANKQLLAQHGEELVAAAREGGAQLRFEAAVAGAIPVIRVVQESLGAIPIEKVFGIVNGTTNYILTEMARSGLSYEEALKQAQDLGYAEADPTDDVGGADAAAKMAILARLAFGAPVGLDDVPYEGIEQIKPDDLAYAKELGLSLKLLGVAERVGDGEVSVRVFPCFLYPGHPLSPISGPFNAVMVESPAITEITMSGPGAGGPETALRGEREAQGRQGRGDGFLSPSRGRGPAGSPRPDRRGARGQRGLGAQRRPAGSGRGGAADHGHAPGFGEALRGRARENREARLPALAAALDPRDRGRVRLGRDRCRPL